MAQSAIFEHEVLTLDEVCNFLRVSMDKVGSEISSGRLPALKIAGEIRILKQDLLDYLDFAKAVPQPTGKRATGNPMSLPAITGIVADLKPADPFDHKWPNGKIEHYASAYSGTAEYGHEVRTVAIGFTERETAGKLRKRAVVFIDRRPMVEFVAANDFEKSNKMVSLVKRKNGKRLRPGEATPPEYKDLSIEPYRKYVTGSYASANLAVVCTANETNVMVKHALVRLGQIEARK